MSTIHEAGALGADAQRDKSAVLIRLLKGPLYLHRQRDLWQVLLREQHSIRDYFQQIGLSLLIDEAEGYAFLKQPESAEEESGQELPRQRLPSIRSDSISLDENGLRDSRISRQYMSARCAISRHISRS